MANLTIDQLKKLIINLPSSRCGTSRCPTRVSLYDVLQSYFSTNAYLIYSNSTLSGNGTLASPLGIAQQGATSGQVLTWNGSTWIPQNPTDAVQLLTLVDDDITLSGGGGTIALGDLITSDGSNILTTGTDGKLKVGTVTGSLPSASTAGQIAYWTGAAWDVALETRQDFSPTSGAMVSISFTPITALPIKVYLNGVLKRNLDDYTISGTTITFTYNFAANDKVTVTYYR